MIGIDATDIFYQQSIKCHSGKARNPCTTYDGIRQLPVAGSNTGRVSRVHGPVCMRGFPCVLCSCGVDDQ